MSLVPQAIGRLDGLIEAQRIAHETIYLLQRSLVGANRETSRSADLLAESSEITLRDASTVTAAIHPLISRWHEQAILDPASAQETAAAITEEFARIEGDLRRLLSRQREIATELRALASNPP